MSCIDCDYISSTVTWVRAAEVVLVETGAVLPGVARFTFGNASDLFVDFQCIGDQPALWRSRLQESQPLPDDFDQTVTSFDETSGYLRLFSEYVQDENNHFQGNIVSIQCLRDNRNSMVNLEAGKRWPVTSWYHIVSPWQK